MGKSKEDQPEPDAGLKSLNHCMRLDFLSCLSQNLRATLANLRAFATQIRTACLFGGIGPDNSLSR